MITLGQKIAEMLTGVPQPVARGAIDLANALLWESRLSGVEAQSVDVPVKVVNGTLEGV